MGMKLVMRTETFGEVGKELEEELEAEEGATVADVCVLIVEFLEDREVPASWGEGTDMTTLFTL